MAIPLHNILRGLGMGVLYLCIGSAGLVFILVMINGSWPDYLYPVQQRLRLGSEMLGFLWTPALIGMIVLPGVILIQFAEWLQGRSKK